MAAAMEQWSLGEGTVIDNYQLVREIGRGGMGVVFEANDLDLQKGVAIKFLNPEATSAEAIQRLQLEARAASKVNHDGVCKVSDMGVYEGIIPYIVMELLRGDPLNQVIEDLNLEEKIDIILQVLSILEAAHKAGIIHRDIKPEHIYLAKNGCGEMTVKLVDFGIAKITDENCRLTKTGTIYGTPFYMSPEQTRGQELDSRTDLWSTGIVLFEMLTGKMPFDGANYNIVISNILSHCISDPGELPQALIDVLMKALAQNQEERFQSAEEFTKALEEALEPEVTLETPTPSETNMIIRISHPKSKLLIVALATMVIIAGATTGISLWHSSTTPTVTVPTEVEPIAQAEPPVPPEKAAPPPEPVAEETSTTIETEDPAAVVPPPSPQLQPRPRSRTKAKIVESPTIWAPDIPSPSPPPPRPEIAIWAP